MRKVNLNMKENEKYKIIKKLVETDGNKKRAAISIGCTTRHINRLIKGYKDKGKEFFVHGNKGKKPAHSLSDEIKDDIVDLYNTKYYDANFTHYSELLFKHDSIKVSPSSIRSILQTKHIVSPKANRSTKRNLKKLLNEKAKKSKSKKEIAKIQELIVSSEDAHPRRPRSAHFGEMIQMDASIHNWFLNEKVYLHVAVDDCILIGRKL